MDINDFSKSVRMQIASKYHFDTDYEIEAFLLGMIEASQDAQAALEKRDKMLRDTVEELYEAKRLLKAAVDDLNFESQCRNCKYQQTGLDNVCNGCRGNKYEWRYADEFKKLYDPITEAVDKIYDRLGIGQTSEITASEIAKMSYEYQEPKEYSGLISE